MILFFYEFLIKDVHNLQMSNRKVGWQQHNVFTCHSVACSLLCDCCYLCTLLLDWCWLPFL